MTKKELGYISAFKNNLGNRKWFARIHIDGVIYNKSSSDRCVVENWLSEIREKHGIKENKTPTDIELKLDALERAYSDKQLDLEEYIRQRSYWIMRRQNNERRLLRQSPR